MTLILSIVKCPTNVSISTPSKTFTEAGGKIGRGSQNEWVLEDPDKYLSTNHCLIDFEAGHYYLTDTSMNGTFVNGSGDPLGKQSRTMINDGDSIELGDYQFQVTINAAQTPLPSFADGIESQSLDSADPFGHTFHSPQDQGFSQEGSAFTSGGQVGAIDESPFANREPFPDPGILASDQLNQDPLQALNNINNLDSSRNEPENAFDDLRSSSGAKDNNLSLTDSFHVPSPQQIIPDNFDLGFSSSEATDKPSQEKIQPAQEIPSSAASAHIPSDSNAESFNIPESFDGLGYNEPLSKTEPMLQPTEPEQAELKQAMPEPAAASIHTPPVDQASTGAIPVAENSPPLQTTDALLEGLGLAEKGLGNQEVQEIHANIGQLLPLIVMGMMQVLRSRTSIKNEFRMNSTMIQPAENNPLKFSAEVNEAIEIMLLNKNGSAYLGAKEAFQDGFDGISEHQIAIIAGMREAFKSMLTQFDPERLEQQFNKENKGVSVPGLQKVKYWNSYVDHYARFIDNMENSFQFLFGDEFVKAYEEQLCRLAVERKQK